MTSLLKSQRPTWRDPPAYRGLLVWTLHLAIVRTTLQMNAPGYLGCFTDCAGFVCNNRVLPVGPKDSDDQSVEWCFRNCLENAESIIYKYAGLEYGNECFCGNNEDYGVQGQVDESQCQDRCTGNSDQICGDSERISMYKISDGVCSNDIGPPANGTHVITDSSSVSYNLNNFKFFGTRVDFSCGPGYTLHGASSIKCIETGDNNVTWSDLVPKCIILSTTVAPYTADDGSTSTGGCSSTGVTETNDSSKGQLQTGTIAGIAVGIIATLAAAVLVMVVICLRKKRANKRTGSSDAVMDAVGSTHINTLLYSLPVDSQPTSTGSTKAALPVNSQVTKRDNASDHMYATADDVTATGDTPSDRVGLTGQDGGESGWVENKVYGCESFPIE